MYEAAGGRIEAVYYSRLTLRALVKMLDQVSDKDTYYLDLPTACPVVYELDANLKPNTDKQPSKLHCENCSE